MKFKTGKEFDPNCGYVGISDRLTICEGYDGGLQTPLDNIFDESDSEEERNTYIDYLNSEECIELADIMIHRWIAFKNQFLIGKDNEHTHPYER